MRIDIIGVRQSIAKDHGLQGQDMSSASLFPDQNGIEDQSAVVIQGSNEIPFLPSCWCPEMKRSVMLD
jgi:hypothetical protein